MHNEWSLIFFTILTQLAIGLVMYYTLFVFYSNRLSVVIESLKIKTLDISLVVIMFIATLISFLHLGSPVHSYNALNNIKTSWISREITGVALFGLGVFLIFCIHWIIKAQNRLTKAIHTFAFISAIYFLIAMSKIYMLPTVLSWNSWYTPFHFFISSLTLGTVVIVFFIKWNKDLYNKYIKRIAFIMVFLLMVDMIAVILRQYELNLIIKTVVLQHEIKDLFVIRIILLISTLIILCYKIYKIYDNNIKNNSFIIITIIVLFVAQLMVGRYMFYASYFKTGI